MKFAALRSFLISHFSFLILILLSTFYFLSPAFAEASAGKSAYAATPTVVPTQTTTAVPNTLHNWTQTVMIEVMSSLTCQVAGIDPINPKQSCLGADQKTGKIGFLPSPQSGGAIGFMGNMISVLYTPPLHMSDYFQNLAQNFGITKKTYAQQTGTGFQSLSPLIGIWSAFRNIVYLLLVIVFVVIGLAIMLRVKIDPRTVMTIQNQIPKIIIGILAVTFSFAIAGFLIDMMWVLIYLIFGIISGIDPNIAKDLNPSVLQGKDVITSANTAFGGVGKIAQDVSGPFTSLLGNILGINQSFGNTFVPFWQTLASTFTNGAVDIKTVTNFIIDTTSWTISAQVFNYVKGLTDVKTPVLGDIWNLLGGNLSGLAAQGAVYASIESFLRTVVPWGIAWLIIFIAVLTALFRLWFTLLMAYVQILLAVVLAPFWIIGGIVPGSPISLGGWFRNVGANLLAFPTVIAMFLLGKVFMNVFGTTQTPGQFAPPLIGTLGATNTVGSLIGLGILLITPNVVTMLKAALKAPKTDMGIGKSLAPGLAVPGRTVSGVGGLAFGSAYETGFLDKPDPNDPTKIKRSALGKAMRLFRGR